MRSMVVCGARRWRSGSARLPRRAELFRCTGPDGKTIYTDQKDSCPGADPFEPSGVVHKAVTPEPPPARPSQESVPAARGSDPLAEKAKEGAAAQWRMRKEEAEQKVRSIQAQREYIEKYVSYCNRGAYVTTRDDAGITAGRQLHRAAPQLARARVRRKRRRANTSRLGWPTTAGGRAAFRVGSRRTARGSLGWSLARRVGPRFTGRSRCGRRTRSNGSARSLDPLHAGLRRARGALGARLLRGRARERASSATTWRLVARIRVDPVVLFVDGVHVRGHGDHEQAVLRGDRARLRRLSDVRAARFGDRGVPCGVPLEGSGASDWACCG